jgi:hypothetical protein
MMFTNGLLSAGSRGADPARGKPGLYHVALLADGIRVESVKFTAIR